MRNIPEREAERLAYERELQREREVSRANAGAATGLLTGVLIVAVLGVIAALFFVTQRNETPAQNQPSQINIEAPPQPQAPRIEAPDINITLPEGQQSPAPVEQAPAAPAAPQPAPEAAPAAPPAAQ